MLLSDASIWVWMDEWGMLYKVHKCYLLVIENCVLVQVITCLSLCVPSMWKYFPIFIPKVAKVISSWALTLKRNLWKESLRPCVVVLSSSVAKLMHNVQQGGRSLLHRFKSFMFTVVLFFWVFFQSKFVICSFLGCPFVPLVTELFVKIKGLKSNKALFSGSYCLLQKHLLAVRPFLPFLIYVTTVCNTLAQSSPSLSFGTPSNRE